MGDLTNRVDAGRTTSPAPPKRRYRLALDLHADTLDELSRALSSVDFDVVNRQVTESTSGGYASGWHYELTDLGSERTHESYIADLTRWRAEKHSIPLGGDGAS